MDDDDDEDDDDDKEDDDKDASPACWVAAAKAEAAVIGAAVSVVGVDLRLKDPPSSPPSSSMK